MSELKRFQEVIGKWSEETFNRKDARKYGITRWLLLKHLKKELAELEVEFYHFTSPQPEVADELADCFILLLDLAELANFDLLDEARKKMKINRKRIWGKPDNDGVIEHIEE